MTAIEVMNALSVLLDDSRQSANRGMKTIMEEALTSAQYYVIEKAIASGDERCLRPLYREVFPILSTEDVQAIALTTFLYPRALKVYFDATMQTANPENGLLGEYLDNSRFDNYVQQPYQSSTPSSIYYTVKREMRTGIFVDALYFNNDDVNDYPASLAYILDPPDFDIDTLTNLSLPAEYHMSVVSYAAALVNDTDVGEVERGEALGRDAKLPLSFWS